MHPYTLEKKWQNEITGNDSSGLKQYKVVGPKVALATI